MKTRTQAAGPKDAAPQLSGSDLSTTASVTRHQIRGLAGKAGSPGSGPLLLRQQPLDPLDSGLCRWRGGRSRQKSTLLSNKRLAEPVAETWALPTFAEPRPLHDRIPSPSAHGPALASASIQRISGRTHAERFPCLVEQAWPTPGRCENGAAAYDRAWRTFVPVQAEPLQLLQQILLRLLCRPSQVRVLNPAGRGAGIGARQTGEPCPHGRQAAARRYSAATALRQQPWCFCHHGRQRT